MYIIGCKKRFRGLVVKFRYEVHLYDYTVKGKKSL